MEEEPQKRGAVCCAQPDGHARCVHLGNSADSGPLAQRVGRALGCAKWGPKLDAQAGQRQLILRMTSYLLEPTVVRQEGSLRLHPGCKSGQTGPSYESSARSQAVTASTTTVCSSGSKVPTKSRTATCRPRTVILAHVRLTIVPSLSSPPARGVAAAVDAAGAAAAVVGAVDSVDGVDVAPEEVVLVEAGGCWYSAANLAKSRARNVRQMASSNRCASESEGAFEFRRPQERGCQHLLGSPFPRREGRKCHLSRARHPSVVEAVAMSASAAGPESGQTAVRPAH